MELDFKKNKVKELKRCIKRKSGNYNGGTWYKLENHKYLIVPRESPTFVLDFDKKTINKILKSTTQVFYKEVITFMASTEFMNYEIPIIGITNPDGSKCFMLGCDWVIKGDILN